MLKLKGHDAATSIFEDESTAVGVIILLPALDLLVSIYDRPILVVVVGLLYRSTMCSGGGSITSSADSMHKF